MAKSEDSLVGRALTSFECVNSFLDTTLCDAHLRNCLADLQQQFKNAIAEPKTSIANAALKLDIACRGEPGSQDLNSPNGPRRVTAAEAQSALSATQQTLRLMEEELKPDCPAAVVEIEDLRKRIHLLEKAILVTCLSQKKLARKNLYVLIDAAGFSPGAGSESLRTLVRELVDAGTGLIQLRDKNLSDRDLVAAGKFVSEITRGSDTSFIINDRADIALAACADGVHLGQDDLCVSDARKIMGAARLIGVSTHTIEQARSAVLAGANYIGVGPVFPSTTKSFDSHVGLELLHQVGKEISLPVFAIGGITINNVEKVVQSGIRRIAVSAAVARAKKPGVAAGEFIEVMK